MSRSDFFLGIDLGSSSVKTSLFDSTSGKTVDSCTYPGSEMEVYQKKMDGLSRIQIIGGLYIKNFFENLSEKKILSLLDP